MKSRPDASANLTAINGVDECSHLHLVWPRSCGSFSLPTIIISRNLISKGGFCAFYWKRQSNVKSRMIDGVGGAKLAASCNVCLFSFGVCSSLPFSPGGEYLVLCVWNAEAECFWSAVVCVGCRLARVFIPNLTARQSCWVLCDELDGCSLSPSFTPSTCFSPSPFVSVSLCFFLPHLITEVEACYCLSFTHTHTDMNM